MTDKNKKCPQHRKINIQRSGIWVKLHVWTCTQALFRTLSLICSMKKHILEDWWRDSYQKNMTEKPSFVQLKRKKSFTCHVPSTKWNQVVLTIRGEISMLATRITELSSARPSAATMLQNTHTTEWQINHVKYTATGYMTNDLSIILCKMMQSEYIHKRTITLLTVMYSFNLCAISPNWSTLYSKEQTIKTQSN